jgi:hypothetical protein
VVGLPEETVARDGKYNIFLLNFQQHVFHFLQKLEQSNIDVLTYTEIFAVTFYGLVGGKKYQMSH